jgi:hypothetical protein
MCDSRTGRYPAATVSGRETGYETRNSGRRRGDTARTCDSIRIRAVTRTVILANAAGITKDSAGRRRRIRIDARDWKAAFW